MIAMNNDTDYVHTHIVNYEPTYLALADIVRRWEDDETNGIADYRDDLQAVVEQHWEAMGLDYSDLTDDVDYAVMIQFEAE